MLKISFISDEYNCYFVVGVWFSLVHPFANIVEWISISYVVDENDTDWTSIIRSRDGFESLLSCLHKEW